MIHAVGYKRNRYDLALGLLLVMVKRKSNLKHRRNEILVQNKLLILERKLVRLFKGTLLL